MTSLHARAAAILAGDLPPDIRDVIEELVAENDALRGRLAEAQARLALRPDDLTPATSEQLAWTRAQRGKR